MNSLHVCTKLVLITCRLFGLFPVTRLFSSSANLRFSLCSPYTIVCIMSAIGQAVLVMSSFTFLLIKGVDARVSYKFVTYGAGFICTLLIQRLAWKWPHVVQEAGLIEKNLPMRPSKNVYKACNLAAGFMSLASIIDLSLEINFYGKLADACAINYTLTESYYRYTMPGIAAFIPYTGWKFAIVMAIYIQIVFVANFTDVFIVIVSLYLTSYFEELNFLIILSKNKYPSIWSVLRVHYTKLSRLVRLVDDNVSPFILFSFGRNIICICVNLFKILRKNMAHDVTHCDQEKTALVLGSILRATYLGYSLTFLILRTLVTALFAARLHTVAQSPISVLYQVPSTCYSSETRRFLEQIHANPVALTGLQFFYVTRKMILSVAATLLTYEFILLQFSDMNH